MLSANNVYCVVCLPGMSEGTGPVTATTHTDIRPGSIGKACKGMEVKINDPDSTGQGEVKCESCCCCEYGLSYSVLCLDLLSWEVTYEWVLEQKRGDNGSH